MNKLIEEKKNLWQSYNTDRSISKRNELVAEYLWLLYHPVSSLYPICRSVCETQDIFQSGVCGLINAVERYEGDVYGASFESFAYKHIRGAMIDWLRRGSLIRQPRTVPEGQNAPKLISLDEYVRDEVGREGMSSLLTVLNPSTEEIALERMEASSLLRALDSLPLNEYIVITQHYFAGLTLNDIAEMLELSKSRISHIRKSAIERLKKILA